MQGATTVLKIMHTTVLKKVPALLKELIPADARSLVPIGDGEKPKSFMRDFCPFGRKKKGKHQHMFSTDTTDTFCPKCKADTRYTTGRHPKAACIALYYDLDDWLTRMYKCPVAGGYLRAWIDGMQQ